VVLLVASTTLLVLVAFLLPLTVLLRTLASDRAVAEATREAQNLAALVAVSSAPQLTTSLTVVNQRGDRAVGVRLPDGTSLGARDHGRPDDLRLALEGRSFTVAVRDGREVYVPVDTAAGRAVVWSFVPDRLLRHGVGTAVTLVVSLGVGLLVLAVALADRLARGTVRPVRALASTALALGSGDLAARAPLGGPHEVREVGHALNVLAQRIGELLAAEREAVADLSHRLRTPLTALRLDVEGVADPDVRARLTGHVENVQRGIDRVIDEARRQVREGVQAQCDAAAVVADRAAFWSVLVEDQGRPFSVAVGDGPRPVRVDASDLGAAVDALLQNAVVHTPWGGAVSVAVQAGADGQTVVVVGDEGGGIPPEAVQRGRSTTGSTGLGLDIARRTAEASGGRLVLGRGPGGGAEVRLELGAPL
jgi:signal transduction histidine kinase